MKYTLNYCFIYIGSQFYNLFIFDFDFVCLFVFVISWFNPESVSIRHLSEKWMNLHPVLFYKTVNPDETGNVSQIERGGFF